MVVITTQNRKKNGFSIHKKIKFDMKISMLAVA